MFELQSRLTSFPSLTVSWRGSGVTISPAPEHSWTQGFSSLSYSSFIFIILSIFSFIFLFIFNLIYLFYSSFIVKFYPLFIFIILILHSKSYSWLLYLHIILFISYIHMFFIFIILFILFHQEHSWLKHILGLWIHVYFFVLLYNRIAFYTELAMQRRKDFRSWHLKEYRWRKLPSLLLFIYLLFTAEYLIQPFNSLRSSLTLYSDMSVYIQTKINIVLNDQVLLGDWINYLNWNIYGFIMCKLAAGVNQTSS